MATSITFAYGATTLTMRPADFSDTRNPTRVQARSRTHDGTLIVGDRELTILRFYLKWNALTDDERDALELFFGPTLVNGALNTFTYIDHFGVSNSVRMITDIVYQNVFTNFWTTDLVFEVVSVEAGS